MVLRPVNKSKEDQQIEIHQDEQQQGTSFDKLRSRLETLERWRELAIRPKKEDCDPLDLDMLNDDFDNLPELSKRCTQARSAMNDNLPTLQTAQEANLVARPSNIPEAGLGLFFDPTIPGMKLRAGDVVCYYGGHIHNFHSSKKLENKDYLLLLDEDILIDAGPLPAIMARYINDPLDDQLVNCKFVPEKSFFRSAVVATRDISPGEELLVAYGDAYWSQRSMGRQLRLEHVIHLLSDLPDDQLYLLSVVLSEIERYIALSIGAKSASANTGSISSFLLTFPLSCGPRFPPNSASGHYRFEKTPPWPCQPSAVGKGVR